MKVTFGETHDFRNYKGFRYRSEAQEDTWTILLGSEPLIGFVGEENVKDFIDKVDDAVEKYAMKPMRLHLTGCKRCQRTANGVKNDPCRRGTPLFLATKANAEKVVRSLVAAVESGRKEADGEES